MQDQTKQHKRAIIIMALVLGIMIIFVSLITNNSSEKGTESASKKTSSSKTNDDYKASSSDSAAAKKASEASEASEASALAAASSASEAAEKDPNSYMTGITYDQVARTPDNYEGKKIQFTGKVIQVIEGESETQVRLAVNGNSDNVILIGFDPDILNGSRILEDDLITASGTSKGTQSYESTMGGKITIPAMTANIITNQGKASDDYGY